jgi:hypothetical protein
MKTSDVSRIAEPSFSAFQAKKTLILAELLLASTAKLRLVH